LGQTLNERLRRGKRGEIVDKAKDLLEDVLEEFEEHKDDIGKELSKAYIYSKRKAKMIGDCPKCGHEMKIITSKRTGKRFVGCSNYPKCHKGFPLPQHGNIKPLHTKCKECGLPEIQVFLKAKRPYTMCINHECKTKENWGNNKSKKINTKHGKD